LIGYQRNVRVPHIMKELTKASYPTNLLFFDTETKPRRKKGDGKDEYHTFWFGWAYGFRREGCNRTRTHDRLFVSINEFWECVLSRLDASRPLYVFAHNLGFDLTIVDFWERCESIPIQIDLPVIDDPPTFFVTTINKCKVYFVDTFNFWRESLESLGKSVNMIKGKMPSRKAPMKDWYAYCQQDVLILAKAVESLTDFLQIHELGSFKLSTPSIAMGTFKYRFMPKDSIYVHDNAKVLEMERSSYHGGMVHCFYIGKIRDCVYKLDVNSLYPSVMLGPMPVKMVGHFKNITVKRMKELLKDHIGCADVFIDSKERTYPYYDGNRLLECRGRYRNILCGPELLNAVRKGDITRCNHLAIYEAREVFGEYVRYFYTLRQRYKGEGNHVGDKLAKILMNSLYGKFGQRSNDWIDLTLDTLRDIYAEAKLDMPAKYCPGSSMPALPYGSSKWFPEGLDKSITIRNVGGKMQVKVDAGEHWESCPIIASYITSMARSRLKGLINAAGSRNVYYVDTDSLFCNRTGYDRLTRANEIDPGKLGKLKLEGTSTDTTIRCPKDYDFDGHIIIKGIRKDAKLITANEYEQTQFEGIRSVLRRGGEAYIKIGLIRKKLSREYHKGTRGKDGWVEFLTLNQDT